MAEPLLQLDVGLDLVEGYVARSFNHYLNTGLPGALCQLPEQDQFMYLGAVCSVSQTTRAETVAE